MIIQIVKSVSCRGWEGNYVKYVETDEDQTLVEWIEQEFSDCFEEVGLVETCENHDSTDFGWFYDERDKSYNLDDEEICITISEFRPDREFIQMLVNQNYIT